MELHASQLHFPLDLTLPPEIIGFMPFNTIGRMKWEDQRDVCNSSLVWKELSAPLILQQLQQVLTSQIKTTMSVFAGWRTDAPSAGPQSSQEQLLLWVHQQQQQLFEEHLA